MYSGKRAAWPRFARGVRRPERSHLGRLEGYRDGACAACGRTVASLQSPVPAASEQSLERPGAGDQSKPGATPDRSAVERAMPEAGSRASMSRLILGVTGSVASIRTPALLGAFHGAGHLVRVVATRPALYFFDPADLDSSARATPGDSGERLLYRDE